MRVFVAIDLPAEVKGQVRECQKILSTSAARLAMVNPEMVHITLKFLGEVEPRMAERIASELERIEYTPFSIVVSGVSGENRHRPRVVWANVMDGGECARLAGMVENALVHLGFEREKRPFVPHVTIARVKQYHNSLQEAIKRISGARLGEAKVEGIALKQSTLRPEGAIYHDLHRVAWR